MKHIRNFQSVVLYAVSVLGQLSIGIITLGLIYFMKDHFGLSSQAIGIFASVHTFSYFIGCTSLKNFISQLKPRHSVETAALGMMTFGFLTVIVPQVWMAFVCYFLYGTAMSFFWPSVMGWLTRGLEGRQLSIRISMFNLSWSLGIILAPYISGLLTEQDIRYPAFAASIVFGLLFIGVFSATKLVPEIRAATSSRNLTKEISAVDSSTPLRFACWAALFSSYFIYGITVNIFPLYARELLGYSESSIGMILLLRGFFTTVIFVLLGRYVWWHFQKIQIYILQILLAGVCFLGIFATSIWLLLLFFGLFGVLFAGIYTNSIFHGAAGSIDRESRMAMHEAVLTSGVILGASLGGSVYEHFSFAAVMAAGAGISLLALTVQILTVKLSHFAAERVQESSTKLK